MFNENFNVNCQLSYLENKMQQKNRFDYKKLKK
jgi:hypothetical protein